MNNREKEKILVINPGSTSTKIALYENQKQVLNHTFHYTAEQLSAYKGIMEQFPMRCREIENLLTEEGVDLEDFSAVAGRGGALPPLKSGAYEVNKGMLDYMRNLKVGTHASSLGAFLADYFAGRAGVKAYIYDGPTVYEMTEVAQLTGIKGLYRKTSVHVLNMRAAVRKAAESLQKAIQDVNMVGVHLGGGITLAAFQKGRMVDALNDSEGPMAPERAGRMPSTDFLKYYSRSGLDIVEMDRILRGGGGLTSWLNTNSALEVERRIEEGDQEAALVYDAMCYQVSKCIGEMAVALDGVKDAIVITGSIANSQYVTESIRKRVEFIAPVILVPGENEMDALAAGVSRVLRGEEQVHLFQ